MDDALNPRSAPRPGSFVRRLAAAIRDEVSFDPRKTLAYGISSGLPRSRFGRVRTALLRAVGLRIGEGAGVWGPINVTGFGDLSLLRIDELATVSGPLHVDLGAEVHIGKGVRLGSDVVLLTVDHEIGPSEYRCGRLIAAPIRIGDGAWIGSRATVLPGISIGAGAVVAACSVVTRDVAPDTRVEGIPARRVQALDGKEAPPSTLRVPSVAIPFARARK